MLDASLSRGDSMIATGPTKSARSSAPRSLNTFAPRPPGDATLGSSARNWPLLSRSGAKILLTGIPTDNLSAPNRSRSAIELTALSIIGEFDAGVMRSPAAFSSVRIVPASVTLKSDVPPLMLLGPLVTSVEIPGLPPGAPGDETSARIRLLRGSSYWNTLPVTTICCSL